MWSPERGWLWWSRNRNDYTIPHLKDGKVWNHNQKRYLMLEYITMGRIHQAWKVLIHGPPGAGKTSIAKTFPSPITGDLEGSTDRYDMARIDLRNAVFEEYKKDKDGKDIFEEPDKQAFSVMNFVRKLGREDHPYKTLVIDTMDWLEPKVWEVTCKRLGIKGMEKMHYGKAYHEALDEWDLFLSGMNYLHKEKDMNILLLAHTSQKVTQDKDMNEIKRHDIKLQTKAAAKFVEWSELIGFLTYDSYVTNKNGKEAAKHDGDRILLVQEDGQYVAKNRFGYQGPPIKPVDYETVKEKFESVKEVEHG